jgi:hypothetical protein
MELRVFNNQIGYFNLLRPSEKTFEFSMALVDEGTRKPVEVDGIKAMITFSGEEDDACLFEDPIGELPSVFRKCFVYADKVWGSTDYKAQCLLFAKLYQENLDAMDEVAVAKHKEKTQKKIDQLQKELGWNTILYDMTEEINSAIEDKIKSIEKSIAYKEKEVSELKEGCESYLKATELIGKYKSQIDNLKTFMITTSSLP